MIKYILKPFYCLLKSSLVQSATIWWTKNYFLPKWDLEKTDIKKTFPEVSKELFAEVKKRVYELVWAVSENKDMSISEIQKLLNDLYKPREWEKALWKDWNLEIRELVTQLLVFWKTTDWKAIRFANCFWIDWVATFRNETNIIWANERSDFKSHNMATNWMSVIDLFGWASRTPSASSEYGFLGKSELLRPNSEYFDEDLYNRFFECRDFKVEYKWISMENSQSEIVFMPTFLIKPWKEFKTLLKELLSKIRKINKAIKKENSKLKDWKEAKKWITEIRAIKQWDVPTWKAALLLSKKNKSWNLLIPWNEITKAWGRVKLETLENGN